MHRFIPKFGLMVLVLVIGPVLTGFGVHAILKPSVSAVFGIEIVKSGLFYLAVVALSLIVYLFLLVLGMRTWERFKEFLRVRFPNGDLLISFRFRTLTWVTSCDSAESRLTCGQRKKRNGDESKIKTDV